MQTLNLAAPEDGVPQARQAGRPMSQQMASYVDQFKRYKIGQSFFVPGATVADLNFLRRPFKRAGLGATFRRVERDEIYQQAGVRVWREFGEYDDL